MDQGAASIAEVQGLYDANRFTEAYTRTAQLGRDRRLLRDLDAPGLVLFSRLAQRLGSNALQRALFGNFERLGWANPLWRRWLRAKLSWLERFVIGLMKLTDCKRRVLRRRRWHWSCS